MLAYVWRRTREADTGAASDLEQTDRSRGSQSDEGGAAEWDVPDGVVVASTSVATFIKMIAAAPRLTAKPSPRVVAMAPSTNGAQGGCRRTAVSRRATAQPCRRWA